MILYHLLIYLFVHSQTLTEHLYSDSPLVAATEEKKEKVKKQRKRMRGNKERKEGRKYKNRDKTKKYKMY